MCSRPASGAKDGADDNADDRKRSCIITVSCKGEGTVEEGTIVELEEEEVLQVWGLGIWNLGSYPDALSDDTRSRERKRLCRVFRSLPKLSKCTRGPVADHLWIWPCVGFRLP